MSKILQRVLQSSMTMPRIEVFSMRCCSTSFKSSLHTDNLYPGSRSTSKFDKYDLSKLPTRESVFSGYIPMNEIQFNYSLSSGPGGQNVQKNNTKVDLRFHLDSATWLSEEVKSIIKTKHSGQLSKDGYLIVKSDRTRSRQLNQADTLQKLRHFIWSSVEEVRTYLEKTQLSEVETEKRLKAQQKAARERVKEKRNQSMLRNHRRVLE